MKARRDEQHQTGRLSGHRRREAGALAPQRFGPPSIPARTRKSSDHFRCLLHELGPLLFIDRMVSNDAASCARVKAEAAAGGGRRPAFTRAQLPATIVHQGQWAAPCRCLNPRPSGRIDRLGVQNSPTQNSKEPLFSRFQFSSNILCRDVRCWRSCGRSPRSPARPPMTRSCPLRFFE
jgi:hypothetical protein